MCTWEQGSGKMIDAAGVVRFVGYSGFGAGKNNPALQLLTNVGPIVEGRYTIGAPIDVAGGPHGPYVLPLDPDPANNMHGRGGFLIHDDSLSHPGRASQGCIVIAGVAARRAIWESGDRVLEVVPGGRAVVD